MEVISFILFFILCFPLTAILEWSNIPRFIAGVLFVIFFCYGLDGEEYNYNHYQRFYEKILVSVAPPQQGIEGSISGAFGFISGSIGQETYYMLREKVDENTYLDFKVVNGAYLVEDDTLKDTGKFVQEFNCHTTHSTYRVLWWNVIDYEKDSCSFHKQSIVVPKGSMIKNMSGI